MKCWCGHTKAEHYDNKCIAHVPANTRSESYNVSISKDETYQYCYCNEFRARPTPNAIDSEWLRGFESVPQQEWYQEAIRKGEKPNPADDNMNDFDHNGGKAWSLGRAAAYMSAFGY